MPEIVSIVPPATDAVLVGFRGTALGFVTAWRSATSPFHIEVRVIESAGLAARALHTETLPRETTDVLELLEGGADAPWIVFSQSAPTPHVAVERVALHARRIGRPDTDRVIATLPPLDVGSVRALAGRGGDVPSIAVAWDGVTYRASTEAEERAYAQSLARAGAADVVLRPPVHPVQAWLGSSPEGAEPEPFRLDARTPGEAPARSASVSLSPRGSSIVWWRARPSDPDRPWDAHAFVFDPHGALSMRVDAPARFTAAGTAGLDADHTLWLIAPVQENTSPAWSAVHVDARASVSVTPIGVPLGSQLAPGITTLCLETLTWTTLRLDPDGTGQLIAVSLAPSGLRMEALWRGTVAPGSAAAWLHSPVRAACHDGQLGVLFPLPSSAEGSLGFVTKVILENPIPPTATTANRS